jgi:hypothetical protein
LELLTYNVNAYQIYNIKHYITYKFIKQIMVSIEEMYDRTFETVKEIDSTVYISGEEGRSGIQIGGNKNIPQVIEVEFGSAVPDETEERFRRLVEGTEWVFVDEDNVFEGENEGNGLISISRDISPENVPSFRNFSKESYLQ